MDLAQIGLYLTQFGRFASTILAIEKRNAWEWGNGEMGIHYISRSKKEIVGWSK